MALPHNAPGSISLSRPQPWVLPDRGLAVFYGQGYGQGHGDSYGHVYGHAGGHAAGHGDVSKLFHYFLPRIVAQGKRALCLDGGNRFDSLLIARFARERSCPASVFNRLLRVSRAFTCFQLTELLARTPRLLRDFSADFLIVTVLPDLYFDEDVREPEAIASFQRALEALREIRKLPLATSVFTDAASFQTPRRKLFAQLVAQADSVSRFEEEEGKSVLHSEKSAPQLPQVPDQERSPKS